jgi:mannose-1-phosphate guanylyltransferase
MIVVVTGAAHADAVAAQLPQLPESQILAEPTPRDSMAAIALAAAVLQHRHGPIVMGSFAADHVIRDNEAFRDTVKQAIAAAAQGSVVTLGIEPAGPSEAFGYIDASVDAVEGTTALRVNAFTEKPDAATAQSFIDRGNFYWNAGMFVVRTDVLLDHLARLQPTLAAGVTELAAAWDGPDRVSALERVWPTLTKIAIDHAIAEPVAAAGGVAVVPAGFEWYDVGDFDSLAGLLTPASPDGTVVDRSAATVFDTSRGAVVIGGTRPVAVVGLDDVVIVDTPEALLVTTREAAQRIKDVSLAVAAAQTVTNS